MASKFYGEFEVSADFVKNYVSGYVNASVVGSWLVVGDVHNFSYPVVYTADDTRGDAYNTLRWCINSDFRIKGFSCDYEIWHVVETPDWMPTYNTLDVVSVMWCDHVEHSDFGETLLHLDVPQLPDGLSVLVTDWGMYAPKDWQVCQPRCIAMLGECEEVQHDSGLPCDLLESFVDFGYACVLRAGWQWADLVGTVFQIHS